MALYSVYARTDAIPSVVPDRFSWFAALLPPVFMLTHGLWLALVGFVIGVVALVLASSWLGSDAAFWLYVLGALWIGFEAPMLRRLKLARAGFAYAGDLVATDADLALSEWVKQAV
ncbi:DUF2628 domain-containing protein [Devosia sp.]|uniref:DUF2628 domain-containing protein n=1 Tax=Devosia sp. TaxID=1871048 RepID=UPI003A94677E